MLLRREAVRRLTTRYDDHFDERRQCFKLESCLQRAQVVVLGGNDKSRTGNPRSRSSWVVKRQLEEARGGDLQGSSVRPSRRTILLTDLIWEVPAEYLVRRHRKETMGCFTVDPRLSSARPARNRAWSACRLALGTRPPGCK